MKIVTPKRVALLATLAGLATLTVAPVRAQSPLTGPLLIGGNAAPPVTLPNNGKGLLLGSNTGFQWLQSYGGPLILNGNGRGLQLVGIGLTNPAWTLDVAGTIQGDTTQSGYNFAAPGIIGKSDVEAGVKGISNNGTGVYGRGGNIGVAAYGSTFGLRAICTVQGGLAGSFTGNVFVGGNLTYTGALTHASDARYKTDVQPLDGALQTIENLHGVTYNYNQKAFPQMNFPATRQVGFIAQEVQSVLPQLVSKDKEGYLSVDYVQVVPVLVEAIKEQQKEIAALKRENQRVISLEARLAALTARVAHTQQVARK